MNTVERIVRLRELANLIGLDFSRGRFSRTDTISLISFNDDSLPIYARDVEHMIGDLDAVENWLNGVIWARDYDRMIRISDDKKRAEGEKREAARIAAMLLKQEQDKAWKILQEKIT